MPDPIPVLRPRLPAAEVLLPYLRRIDAAGVYSNWGPLCTELEERLTGLLGLPPGTLTSASSGTAALDAAILAVAGRATEARPFALLPAFTFVATAAAAEHCGYRPLLCDVDPETWMLDPGRIEQQPDLARVGVVVPVAAFGRPVPIEPWQAFEARTAVPVAVDGGASFDRIVDDPGPYTGTCPVAMSFHATKSFSTGEGGCVVSTDPTVVGRAAKALNFGFFATRDSECASLNGKLSEYHAAVGLAELDGWDGKRSALEVVAASYRSHLAAAGLAGRLEAWPSVSRSYVLVRAESPHAGDQLACDLHARGIDTRLWYDRGLHRHSWFSGSPREALPVTDRLAPTLLGLPNGPRLADADVARVVEALGHAPGASKLSVPPVAPCGSD